MKRNRTCWHCREPFPPDPRRFRPTGRGRRHRSDQHFCSKPECRQASHRRSNQAYWKKDPDLRQRNAVAASAWRRKNKSYWRAYRAKRPDYVKRNREQQRRRDHADLANTDVIGALRREKLSRIRVLIRLANTDLMQVPWTVVSEEICLYLKWQMRLANTNLIDRAAVDNSQSPA